MEGGNNCGVVLVVNIYYKLWKERHNTHNNGQRLDDAQLVHKSSTSATLKAGPVLLYCECSAYCRFECHSCN